jgi:probable rRNA maturation factor
MAAKSGRFPLRRRRGPEFMTRSKPAAVRPAPGRRIVITNRHPRLRVNRREVTAAIRLLDAQHAAIRIPRPAFLSGELSIVFLTDDALAGLHGKFLDDPSITDVITFEAEPAFGLAGEICVSADAAGRHVGRRRDPAKFSAELMLYLVHGWLHLAGYDDLKPALKRAMRRAEARAMALLRRSDQLPHFRLEHR